MNETLNRLVDETQHWTYVISKLRGDIESIFNIFQSPQWCQVCREREDEGQKHDFTKANMPEYHHFVPSIDIPFEIYGEYFKSGANEYRLEAHPETDDSWPCVNLYNRNTAKSFGFDKAYKTTLKELVNSGQILKFFDHMVATIKAANEEYDRAAEAAEKMRKALELWGSVKREQ